jgi:hypothetical protein
VARSTPATGNPLAQADGSAIAAGNSEAHQPPTTTSVLNFLGGSNRANNAAVALGVDGDVVATANGTGTHLVIDVVGYFEGD